MSAVQSTPSAVPSTPPPLKELRPGLTIGPRGIPQFAKGNKFGASEAKKSRHSRNCRLAMEAAVQAEDIMEIMVCLVEKAKQGNLTAAREVLDRIVGKPDETAMIKKLEELEAVVSASDDFEDEAEEAA